MKQGTTWCSLRPLQNGSVTIRVLTPALPDFQREFRPLAVLARDSELQVYALAAPTVAQPATPGDGSFTSKSVGSEKDLPSVMLESGQDFAAQVGSGVILDLFSEANQWPLSARTVLFHGTSQKGDIISRTGGLPLGNGFYAHFEDPARLNGQIVITRLDASWLGAGGVGLSFSSAIQGSAQVQAHGNAPHPRPSFFGKHIGGVSRSAVG